MPKLDDLNLSADATPEVDWDAPESGNLPPALKPGEYLFLFKLSDNREDWFDAIEAKVGENPDKTPIKRRFLVLQYTPVAVANSGGTPIANEDGTPITLPKQRSSFYKSDKMLISQGAELLRCLGIKITGAMTPAAVEQAVQQVDGRVQFNGQLGWRTFFRDTETTVSTFPRRKKGELAWPQNGDRTYQDMAVDPSTGQKAYGYPEIYRVKALKPTS
jgi:hypothetical protein